MLLNKSLSSVRQADVLSANFQMHICNVRQIRLSEGQVSKRFTKCAACSTTRDFLHDKAALLRYGFSVSAIELDGKIDADIAPALLFLFNPVSNGRMVMHPFLA